jgi:hypothetical protein
MGLRYLMGRMVQDVKDLNPFPLVFGEDAKVCEQASPVKHLRKGLPPFLLVNAELDIPTLPLMTKEFAKALQKEGNEVTALTVNRRGHGMIVFLARSTEDPLGKAIVQFLAMHEK